MKISQAAKVTLAVLPLFFLSGCATKVPNFPSFSETVKSHTTVPVVLDVLVHRDIKGNQKGFNLEANKDVTSKSWTLISNILSERDFDPLLLQEVNGLSGDWLDQDLVHSNDWKSTNQVFEGPVLDDDSEWMTETNRAYLDLVFEVGKLINLSDGKDQQTVESTFGKSLSSTPDLFSSSARREGVVLLVRVRGRLQRLDKTIASNVVAAAATASVLGGLALTPFSPNKLIVDVAMVDVRDGKIIWFNQGFGLTRHGISEGIKSAFYNYPNKDGETKAEVLNRKKREAYFKRRGIDSD